MHLEDTALKVSHVFCSDRPGVGLPLLLISICCVCFFTKNAKFKLGFKLIVVGLVLAFLSTDLFPWKLLNDTIMTKIQFPWRLFTFAVCFLAIGVGGCINFSLHKIKQRQIFLIFIFVLTNIFAVNVLTSTSIRQSILLPENVCNQAHSVGGGGEWLPVNTDISKLNTPNQVYISNGKSIDLNKRIGNTIYFEYNENSDGKVDYFDVPLLFYKGYSATILMPDGTTKDLDVVKSTNNNLCRVMNKENYQGEICVKYSGTKLQHISYFINFLSIILICIFFKFFMKKHHNSNLYS